MTHDDSLDDRWLFLPDAAQRLNVAPQTICRKIKRGEFESRQVPTRTGLAYQVRLVDGPGLSPEAIHDQPTQSLAGMVSLLRGTQAALLARTEAAAMWQARAEMLAGELAAARDQVRALQAPSPEPEPASPALDAIETPRRPWYQRLLFG